MANTVVQIKRTSVSGRAANDTTLTNVGELGLNLPDGIMYSTNGTVIFEIGANNTNSQVTGTFTVKAISANGSLGSAGQVLSSNGTSTYWATGSGGATDLTYDAATRLLSSSSGADVTLPLFASGNAGLTPASGGGTTNFLRADGTWQPAGGGSPGGSNTHIQFNDSTAFAGDANLTFQKDTGRFTVGNSTVNVAIATAQLIIGANVTVNTSTVFVGNSTVNAVHTASDFTKNGVSIVDHGQQTIWVPASAMYPQSSNGAFASSAQTATNSVMIKTLDFDTTNVEHAQFAIQMPKSWNLGTLVCQAIWSHAATTTNFGVVWEIMATALSDTNAIDTAWGTAVSMTDTGGTTNALYISPESAVMTVGNTPAAEDYVVFRIRRATANASDTMAIDARLHGVKVHYTTNASKDD
jgi:hypothetical protein